MIPLKRLTDEECQVGMRKICDLVKNSAKESGVRLQLIQIDDGHRVTCKPAHTMLIAARGKSITFPFTHDDVRDIESAKLKIRSALSKLLLLMESRS
jgi:hypothetical protein